MSTQDDGHFNAVIRLLSLHPRGVENSEILLSPSRWQERCTVKLKPAAHRRSYSGNGLRKLLLVLFPHYPAVDSS